jgi:hypothetical protein
MPPSWSAFYDPLTGTPIDFLAVLALLLTLLQLTAPLGVVALADPTEDSPPTQGSDALPQARSLLAAYIRAVGGAPAIATIKSMEVKGEIHLPGGRLPGTFRWAVADGHFAAFETSFPGLGRSAFGSDGTVGWSILELPGQRTVETLSLEEVDRRRRRANWYELAFTLPDRATSMHTVGEAVFDGTAAWEIHIDRADGRTEQLFIDRNTHRLLGFATPMDIGDDAPLITVRFGDWRKEGPLMLFHRIEISGGSTRVGLGVKEVLFDTLTHADFAAPPMEDADG